MCVLRPRYLSLGHLSLGHLSLGHLSLGHSGALVISTRAVLKKNDVGNSLSAAAGFQKGLRPKVATVGEHGFDGTSIPLSSSVIGGTVLHNGCRCFDRKLPSTEAARMSK